MGGFCIIVSKENSFQCPFIFFLSRRHRTKQFLKRKKEFEILQDLNKEFSDSLHSEEIFPSRTASSTEMVLLQNGRVPVHGEKVQYTDWARRQPQPSPLLYAKRVQDIHPSGKQYTQRVLTMPAKSQTVFTHQPKVRHYYTLNACMIYTPGGDNTPSVCSLCQLNHRLCSPINQRYVITIR